MSYNLRPVFLSYVELLILLGFMLTAGFLVGYFEGHQRGTALCAEASDLRQACPPGAIHGSFYCDGKAWKVLR